MTVKLKNKTRINNSFNKPTIEKKVGTRSTIDKDIKKIAQKNPDLPESFIEDIILAQQEVVKGNVTPYKFG
ncbi:MAG: hypothetical protein OXH90_08610 [Paracoccaceae bacterium]|nr:hypothetical protein [Paracoccaceae bacterium]MDE2918121.1 hypothetical protein [Paracoccaceae bacterium]